MRREALAAVAFLTRVPIRTEFDADEVRRAGVWFPVVGAGVGGLAGALAQRLPPPLAGVLSCAAQTALTGALHVDALADTADALGVVDRARALEVMRDPRLGSFGGAALALDLLVKSAALGALEDPFAVGVAAGALSRATPVALAAWLPYARAGQGTGLAITGTPPGHAAATCALGLLCSLGLGPRRGLSAAALAAAVSAGVGFGCRRRFGGVTGDTLGAALELTETSVLALCAAWGAR